MSVKDQARELEDLLPRVLRKLFSADAENIVTGLPLAQLRVARVLMSGDHTISSLGEELSISVSAVTQLADRMEKAGLVERAQDSRDRRIRILRLTGSGAALMRRRQTMRVAELEKALSTMSADDRDHVLDGLHRLLEAAGASPAKPGPLSGAAR